MNNAAIPLTNFFDTTCGLSFRTVKKEGVVFIEIVDRYLQREISLQPVNKPYRLSYEKISFQRRFAQAYGEIYSAWRSGLSAYAWLLELFKFMYNSLNPDDKIKTKMVRLHCPGIKLDSISVEEYILPWIHREEPCMYVVRHNDEMVYYGFNSSIASSDFRPSDQKFLSALWEQDMPKWAQEQAMRVGLKEYADRYLCTPQTSLKVKTAMRNFVLGANKC